MVNVARKHSNDYPVSYIYCYPDGMPFYVGSGGPDRPYQMYGRNRRVRTAITKTGKRRVIKIIIEHSTYVKAQASEKKLLQQLRLLGTVLTVQDYGGGFAHSEATKRKMSKKRAGVFHTKLWNSRISAAVKSSWPARKYKEKTYG